MLIWQVWHVSNHMDADMEKCHVSVHVAFFLKLIQSKRCRSNLSLYHHLRVSSLETCCLSISALIVLSSSSRSLSLYLIDSCGRFVPRAILMDLEPWIISYLDIMIRSLGRITLFFANLVLVTTGLKVRIPKELSWLIQFLMSFVRRPRTVIAYKVFIEMFFFIFLDFYPVLVFFFFLFRVFNFVCVFGFLGFQINIYFHLC